MLLDFQRSRSEKERETKTERASLTEGRCYKDREEGRDEMKVKLASCMLAFMWVISFTLFQILIKSILLYLLFIDKDAEA